MAERGFEETEPAKGLVGRVADKVQDEIDDLATGEHRTPLPVSRRRHPGGRRRDVSVREKRELGHGWNDSAMAPRENRPARWSRKMRNWTPVGPVTLNPERNCIVNACSDDTLIQPLAA